MGCPRQLRREAWTSSSLCWSLVVAVATNLMWISDDAPKRSFLLLLLLSSLLQVFCSSSSSSSSTDFIFFYLSSLSKILSPLFLFFPFFLHPPQFKIIVQIFPQQKVKKTKNTHKKQNDPTRTKKNTSSSSILESASLEREQTTTTTQQQQQQREEEIDRIRKSRTRNAKQKRKKGRERAF